jgi:hypothetical protein
MNDTLERVSDLFGGPPSATTELPLFEAPWGKSKHDLASASLLVVRFDGHASGVAYVTAGLAAEGSLQTQVGGKPYEIVFCLPAPAEWATGLVAQLAQLSIGYALSGRRTWANLRREATSMGRSFSVPAALRDSYDGLAFLAYRPAASPAPRESMRLRLAIGIDHHELKVSDAKLASALRKHGFWPVTPTRRDNVVDLAERWVSRLKKEETDEQAKSLITGLVQRGDLALREGSFDRVVERLVPLYQDILEHYDEEDADRAVATILEFFELDSDVEEVFADDEAAELKTRVARAIARAEKRR